MKCCWLLILGCLMASFTGCLLRRTSPALPVGGSITRDQLIIYSDFDLPQRHRLIEDLVALRRDIALKLQMPTSDEPIHVYLFDTPRRYRAFMKRHYDQFSDRRAFFVQDDTTLSVYAHWGEHVSEDLRHEVSHGYLHSVVPNISLWLDEGLAEYFEVPRGQRGMNHPHAELLWERYKRDEWTPDLARLEQLSHASEMTQLDYAESWLWIHLLMESTPERLAMLQGSMQQLLTTGSAPRFATVLQEVEPSTERVLVQHLKTIIR